MWEAGGHGRLPADFESRPAGTQEVSELVGNESGPAGRTNSRTSSALKASLVDAMQGNNQLDADSQRAANSQTSRPLRRPLVDAMQGENRLESGAYTQVREHFEPVFNAISTDGGSVRIRRERIRTRSAPPAAFSPAC
jgi:hypothetical protein